MISGIRKSGLLCNDCGEELLVKDHIVFCEKCRNRKIPKNEKHIREDGVRKEMDTTSATKLADYSR